MNDNRAPTDTTFPRVIELSGDFSQKAASGTVVSAQDPIRAFFDRFLDDAHFECVVLVGKKPWLGRKGQVEWPQVITSAIDARSARKDLEGIAKAGFELIVGTKASPDNIESFFKKLGYTETGTGRFADESKHDPARAAWNKEGFSRAVNLASKLCDRTLCVFAHDGDPVYLLAV